jgi:hypothetical protein
MGCGSQNCELKARVGFDGQRERARACAGQAAVRRILHGCWGPSEDGIEIDVEELPRIWGTIRPSSRLGLVVIRLTQVAPIA